MTILIDVPAVDQSQEYTIANLDQQLEIHSWLRSQGWLYELSRTIRVDDQVRHQFTDDCRDFGLKPEHIELPDDEELAELLDAQDYEPGDPGMPSYDVGLDG